MELSSLYRRSVAFSPERFGRNVAADRARLGLKPKELASRMGVNPATIYRIERGERTDIGRPQLEALARALELDAGGSSG
jgi:transcriptional regulator with XRE-family HTH domain